MTNRRDFLKSTAAGALAAAVLPLSRATAMIEPHPAKPLDILVLGGTGFIGPHLVRYAVSRGHRVTIFTRGRRDGDLPAEVIRLQGDRNGQLDSLKGKKWDVVIDDSATNPAWVELSTDLLKDAVGAYLFTSSTGVYYPYLQRGVDENDAVHTEMKDPKDLSEDFGVKKAKCEGQVMKVFGDRGMVVRPTYIVGPGDTTDRFPYWPQRLARGGEVLAPGKKDDPMQIIDVRDLAEFMVRLVESDKRGIFNVAGPAKTLTIRSFYEQAVKALDAKVKYTFIEDYDFLAAHKIDEQIPWVMQRGNDYGHMSVRNDKAIKAGLTIRPLATTLRDTLTWWEKDVPAGRKEKPRFAITPEMEATALMDWHKKRGG